MSVPFGTPCIMSREEKFVVNSDLKTTAFNELVLAILVNDTFLYRDFDEDSARNACQNTLC